MTSILRFTGRACGLLSCLFFTSLAGASDAMSHDEVPQDGFSLDEETTLHRYRPDPLQWTAQSITVVGAEELAEMWREDVADLEGLAPGLIVDELAANPQGASIALRGVGSRGLVDSLFPAVAVNVDGVYMGTHAAQNQPLYDVSHLEIVRGPNATYRSAPAAGGSIDLYRTRPQREISGNARITYGDYVNKRFDGVFNFPILSNMAMRLGFNWERGGAKVMKNIDSGRKENEAHYSGGMVALLWEIDNASVQYTYDGVHDKSDVPALVNLSSTADLLCDGATLDFCSSEGDGILPETVTEDRTLANFSNNRDYSVSQHALHINLSLLDHEIRSITASRNTDETSNTDLDATNTDFYSTTRFERYQQVSQELSIFKQLTPAFSYDVGAYYLSIDRLVDRGDFFILDSIAGAGATPGEVRSLYTESDVTLRSLFGHIDFLLSERWTVDAGVRWTEVDHNFYHVASEPGGPAVREIDAFEENDEISATLGFAYRVDDSANFFTRYTHGFRPLGFDIAANSEAGAEIGDEDVDTAEMGIKTQWLDDRLRFNYTIYRNKYRNKAERITEVIDGNVESVMSRVATIENLGHEIEIEAVPLDNLKLRASLNHMNADYVWYRVPDPNDPATEIDLESRVPLMSPSDMFKLSGLYSFPYGQGTVRVYGGYRFTTQYVSDHETAKGTIENFTILDFSIEFAWREWTFRWFSTNANGKRYFTNVNHPHDAEVVSLPAAGTISTQSLLTSAQVSEPEFTGFSIVYVPGS